MRLIVSENNWVVGDRSGRSLWLWDLGTYSVKYIIIKTKWEMFDNQVGGLEALEGGKFGLDWSNLLLPPALPGMSRPCTGHQSPG